MENEKCNTLGMNVRLEYQLTREDFEETVRNHYQYATWVWPCIVGLIAVAQLLSSVLWPEPSIPPNAPAPPLQISEDWLASYAFPIMPPPLAGLAPSDRPAGPGVPPVIPPDAGDPQYKMHSKQPPSVQILC